ncbi:MAG: MBL fold metallo-hydrolase [Pseudomonadota bacterium]
MSATLTILGCGSSGGVPRLGNQWGKCDPGNPKNRRRRCSVLIEKTTSNGTTRVLIDTSPDVREQLLDAHVDHLDAVVYTHDHADHTHGIDDLRVLALIARKRVRVYYDAATRKTLNQRFGYCFKAVAPEYPPILEGHEIEAGDTLVVKGAGGKLTLQPFAQEHGAITSLGIRCGALAYSSDISDVPDGSLAALQDLDVWIVDALRYDYHPAHFAVKDALHWIERMAPKRALLTHLHIDLDHDILDAETPAHVAPAFDGMKITFDDTPVVD